LTPEKADVLARQMGLDQAPRPRLAVPTPNKPIPAEFRPHFYKALMLVDQIESWAFERFIPDFCVIDTAIDARTFSPELSFAVVIRTDVPPPSNQKIMAATGIQADSNTAENQYRWLGIEVGRHYREIGAVAMGAPLVYRTKGTRGKMKGLIVPQLGAIMKFDRTPKDGLSREDMMADVGVLVPRGTPVKGRDMPWPTEE
jgi:hypothetical protein